MNEVIGPLYYTFASDPDPNWRGKFILYVVKLTTFPWTELFFFFQNLLSMIHSFAS